MVERYYNRRWDKQLMADIDWNLCADLLHAHPYRKSYENIFSLTLVIVLNKVYKFTLKIF